MGHGQHHGRPEGGLPEESSKTSEPLAGLAHLCSTRHYVRALVRRFVADEPAGVVALIT
jgi:hypothetical protein